MIGRQMAVGGISGAPFGILGTLFGAYGGLFGGRQKRKQVYQARAQEWAEMAPHWAGFQGQIEGSDPSPVKVVAASSPHKSARPKKPLPQARLRRHR